MKVVMGCPIFKFQDLKIRKNHESARRNSIHEVIYVELVGASVEHAKQIMYKEFLKTDAEYFFNVDADIFFMNLDRVNPIDELVKEAEKRNGIVGGIYVYKRLPTKPSHRTIELQKIYEDTGYFPESFKFNIPNNVHEVMWLAGGCMMIKREIIEKLVKKYKVPNLPTIYKGEYLSEDFAFCNRAREEGYRIFADPFIKLGHSGEYLYSFDDI